MPSVGVSRFLVIFYLVMWAGWGAILFWLVSIPAWRWPYASSIALECLLGGVVYRLATRRVTVLEDGLRLRSFWMTRHAGWDQLVSVNVVALDSFPHGFIAASLYVRFRVDNEGPVLALKVSAAYRTKSMAARAAELWSRLPVHLTERLPLLEEGVEMREVARGWRLPLRASLSTIADGTRG